MEPEADRTVRVAPSDATKRERTLFLKVETGDAGSESPGDPAMRYLACDAETTVLRCEVRFLSDGVRLAYAELLERDDGFEWIPRDFSV